MQTLHESVGSAVGVEVDLHQLVDREVVARALSDDQEVVHEGEVARETVLVALGGPGHAGGVVGVAAVAADPAQPVPHAVDDMVERVELGDEPPGFGQLFDRKENAGEENGGHEEEGLHHRQVIPFVRPDPGQERNETHHQRAADGKE